MYYQYGKSKIYDRDRGEKKVASKARGALLGVEFKGNIDEIFGPASVGTNEFEIEEIGQSTD